MWYPLHALCIGVLVRVAEAVVIAAPSADKATLVARQRNFKLCRRKASGDALARLGLNASELPAGAELRLCEDRRNSHVGVVYVANFVTAAELKGLRRADATLLEPNKSYSYHVYTSPEDRAAHPAAAAFEQRVARFTGLRPGVLQLAATGDREPLLHHDHAKGFTKRQVTSILYIDAPEAGGHTVFPFLSTPAGVHAEEPTVLAQLLDGFHLDVLQAYRSNRLPQHKAWRLTKAKCDDLADADATGRASPHFGVRPAAGDALFFWQCGAAGGHAAGAPAHFHAGCSSRGRKVALQKFAEGAEAHNLDDEPTVKPALLQTLDNAMAAYQHR